MRTYRVSGPHLTLTATCEIATVIFTIFIENNPGTSPRTDILVVGGWDTLAEFVSHVLPR